MTDSSEKRQLASNLSNDLRDWADHESPERRAQLLKAANELDNQQRDIALLRADLENPPGDVQEAVLRKLDLWPPPAPAHETKACVWEDCDQEAIYCAGHAREFVRGEPVKAADPKMVPCTACGNKPIDAQHCDVCYPPGACEWCATGIPRSTDGRRHESDMGVWACRSPAPKAKVGDAFPEDGQ